MRKEATIDQTGVYRYHLSRVWDERCERVAFVMLNPSTADAAVDDPTIRRCIAFAKAWGFGGLEVVNLFAFRATDPRELRRAALPIGPANDGSIAGCAGQCALVVCAWGTDGALYRRGPKVLERLLASKVIGHKVRHLGLTKSGHPRHPLYLRGDTLPQPWPATLPGQDDRGGQD